MPLLVGGGVLAAQLAGVPVGGEVRIGSLVLLLSLVAGGAPYALTAALLWPRIARCTSRRSAVGLMLIAPLVFTPLQVIATWLWSMLQPGAGAGIADALLEGLLAGLIMAVYALLFGYAYATTASLAFLGATRVGLVSGFPAPEAGART